MQFQLSTKTKYLFSTLSTLWCDTRAARSGAFERVCVCVCDCENVRKLIHFLSAKTRKCIFVFDTFISFLGFFIVFLPKTKIKC